MALFYSAETSLAISSASQQRSMWVVVTFDGKELCARKGSEVGAPAYVCELNMYFPRF